MMNLETLQRYVPSFDPSKYDRMPFPGETFFSNSSFPDSDDLNEAENTARELIRASLSEREGGKRIYSQCEAIGADARFAPTQIMYSEVISGKAVIR